MTRIRFQGSGPKSPLSAGERRLPQLLSEFRILPCWVFVNWISTTFSRPNPVRAGFFPPAIEIGRKKSDNLTWKSERVMCMDIRYVTAPGCFGDNEVLLHIFTGIPEEKEPVFLLFHGVHGCASPAEGNKYGYLGRSLAEKGVTACIAESSRIRRDRETFGEDRAGWALAAFRGKTFPMEVYDACSALAAVGREFPGRPVILWGFSLGGILSVLLAGKETESFLKPAGFEFVPYGEIQGLVISGTGDLVRPEASASLALPILDTLGERRIIHVAASKARPSFVLFFYGSEDETFGEDSSRRIFQSFRLGEERKTFCILDGADHSFRKLNGVSSREALEKMVAVTTANLERFRKTE